MNGQQYTALAIKTESKPESLQINEAILHASLRVLIGAAELANQVKRKLYYGKPLSIENLDSALGEIHHLSRFIGNCLSDTAEEVNRRFTAEESSEAFSDETPLNIDGLNIRLLHGALGIFSESGEMLEALKKQFETGELDVTNFGEETGDVDWYKAIIHDETGIGEDKTRPANISKLQERYPDKFSAEAAVNRDTDAERKVLEENLNT